MWCRVAFTLVCLVTLVSGLPVIRTDEKFLVPKDRNEKNSEFWRKMGENIYKLHTKTSYATSGSGRAKNVILFLGDGMGVTTVTAARIYKGQQNGKSGEEETLSFETFPHTSFAKTYSVNRQTPDSAATATAFLTGVKTNTGVLGVDARVDQGNCSASLDNSTHLSSIVSWAQEAGKWTGVVTTTRITHATPAASYAHTAHRDWEAYVDSKDPEAENCLDIADQLVNEKPGKDIRVIMGGGLETFRSGNKGKRKDNRDLVEEWKNRTGQDGAFVTNRTQLLSDSVMKKQYLLGLFADSHMSYELDKERSSDVTEPPTDVKEPSIAEMTETAIKFLKRSKNGYFLLVEGGRIDHGHHANKAAYALQETVSMDEAVQKAVSMTSEDDTLILVTADHSHVFTVAGYPDRGTNILGIAGVEEGETNFTFPILSYANGPGKVTGRKNLTFAQTVKKDYVQMSTSYLKDDTHGAEDVGVYARGPMAHVFSGVYEQNFIAHGMAHASCVGAHRDDCSAAVNLKPWLWTWLLIGLLPVTFQNVFFSMSPSLI